MIKALWQTPEEQKVEKLEEEIAELEKTVKKERKQKEINQAFENYPFPERYLKDLLIAQSLHETGRWTSDLATNPERKNLFGMRCAQDRDTTNQKCVNNYSTYSSYRKSIEDIFLYLDYVNFFTYATGFDLTTAQSSTDDIELGTPSTDVTFEEVEGFEAASISEDPILLRYVKFLKQKGYFEDSVSNYYLGCKSALEWYVSKNDFFEFEGREGRDSNDYALRTKRTQLAIAKEERGSRGTQERRESNQRRGNRT